MQRESTFLRYTANVEALQDLLQFLYSECCTRNKAVKPRDVVSPIGRIAARMTFEIDFQEDKWISGEYQRNRERKIWAGGVARKRGEAVAVEPLQQAGALRSDHIESLRCGAGGTNSRGGAAGITWLRKSDGAGET